MKTTTKTQRTRTSRKVSEARVRYHTRTPGRSAKVKEAHLEFYITLPKLANVDEFSDKLIELVEAFGGTVGGGIVLLKGE